MRGGRLRRRAPDMSLPKRIARYLAGTFGTLDERSLGLGRVALALALLADLGKRVPGLETWYTNAGLLPNHTLLWRPTREHTLSLFFVASHWYEVAFGFVLCALAYLLLLVGYRTRLAQILSFVAVTSLHGRTMFIQIGADVALSALSFWTLFLPLGRCFSVDALLRRLRALERGERADESPRGVTSLACFALLFQLAIIYGFNAWQKNGTMWRDGTLLHYVLHLDALVTGFGLRLRPLLSHELSAGLTHATRIAEALVPVLLFVPVWKGFARGLAALVIVGLHTGIALLMNVGLFSLVMMAYTPNLLPSGFWEFWEARRRKRAQRDGQPCGEAGEDFAKGVGAIIERPERLRSVLRGMPWGLFLLDVARLPFAPNALAWLAERAVRRARRDVATERALGTVDAPPGKRRAWLGRLRFAVLGLALYLCWAQAGVENPVLPKWAALPQPAWGAALVHYLQLYQGWRMFAPEAMRTDIALSVDAVTTDGRLVDPFNELTRPGRPPPRDRIPPRLGYDVYVNSYFGRIAETPAYHTAFSEWILRYHERTGRPEDRLVSFEASLVMDQSPPPGKTEPSHPRRTVFLRWPQR